MDKELTYQFSIVCPVYNAAPFLKQAIESVLTQTYPHWELILVDDGSTDESASICEHYVKFDSRVKLIRKKNGGQASARNLGITHAQFEWIAFLDADDWWVNNKLEIQIDELITSESEFLYSAGYEYTDGKTYQYPWHFEQFTNQEFFRILFKSCAVNCNTVVVKKSLLEKTGIFDEASILRGVEDWDLWLRISKNTARIFGSKKPLAYYRIHGGGIHHQHARMYIGRAYVYDKYRADKTIPRLARLRQYRYTYRELLNYLYDENRHSELKLYVREFLKRDYLNPSVWKQVILVHVLPASWFNFLSSKVIYRIAYRLEYMTYLLGLSQKWLKN